jgi:hypothetical protein
MVDQHCIAATLATAAAVATVQVLLAEAGEASRTEIAGIMHLTQTDGAARIKKDDAKRLCP